MALKSSKTNWQHAKTHKNNWIARLGNADEQCDTFVVLKSTERSLYLGNENRPRTEVKQTIPIKSAQKPLWNNENTKILDKGNALWSNVILRVLMCDHVLCRGVYAYLMVVKLHKNCALGFGMLRTDKNQGWFLCSFHAWVLILFCW